MQKILFILFGFAALTYSCETGFSVAADYKEIPIIIGLLDIQDTVHYVSITKAYLDEEQDALLLAQIADSLYYEDELTVTIEEYNNSTMVSSKELARVDGNDIGFIRDEGVFIDAPNILYQYSHTLSNDNTYKLILIKNDTGLSVTAETNVVNEFNFITTTTPQNTAPFQAINFVSLTRRVFDYRIPHNSKFYDLNVVFNYSEIQISDSTDVEDKHITLNFQQNSEIPFRDQQLGVSRQFSITQDEFFDWIITHIPENQAVFRCPGLLDINFAFGDSTFYEYFQANNANDGLTIGQASTLFTNIDGGFGLFASRQLRTIKLTDLYEYAEQEGVEISDVTRDSLANSLITQHLNFIESRTCID